MSAITVIQDLLSVLRVDATPFAGALASSLVPRPVSSYGDDRLTSLAEVLLHRIHADPLNLLATIIFFMAILHTFFAPMFLRVARRIEERRHLAWISEPRDADDDREEPASFIAVTLHYLGEIEAVFGVWAIPLLVYIAATRGWSKTEYFIERTVQFKEAVFVVVVMAIASTQPILYLAERVLAFIARLLGGTPTAWWITILSVGPLLGSLITEPASMTICALLLAQHFFRFHPSLPLAYATLALLFSNISIGGVLTHFAAPPVIMVASSWGWDSGFMFRTFGWRAIGAVLSCTAAYYWLFRRDLVEVARRGAALEQSAGPVHERPVSWFVIAGNVGFLAWTVTHATSPRMVIIGFLFFLAFVDATRHFQRSVSLRAPLLVGFFLAGLVIHGEFQAWWIEPLITRLDQATLCVSSIALSAFNDNASITYLASLVPTFPDDFKYTVVAGAIAGGGLTIIANAPNPAGNALLSRFFDGGISPVRLLFAALVPLIINLLFFFGLR